MKLTAPKTILLFIILVGLGVWGWTQFLPSPEKQIERTLHKLAAAASFKNEKPLDRLIAVRAVPSFFHTNALVQISHGSYTAALRGKTEIRQAVAGLRSAKRSAQVQLDDPQIQLDGKTRATALVACAVQLEDDPTPQRQILKFRLEKTNRKWRIQQVESIRPNNIQPRRFSF